MRTDVSRDVRASVTESIGELTAQTVANKNRIEQVIHDTAGEFRKLRDEIKTQFDTLKKKPGENIQEEVRRIVEQEVDKSNLLASITGSTTVKSSFPPPRRSMNDETRTNNYWRARRSLRAWPVLGDTSQELWTGLGRFLDDFLGIPDQEVGVVDIEHINGSSPKLAQDQTKKKSLSSSERYPSETESSLTGENLPPVLTVVVNLPQDCRLKFRNTLLGSSLTSRPIALTSRRNTALVLEEILNFAMLTKPWSWTYRSPELLSG